MKDPSPIATGRCDLCGLPLRYGHVRPTDADSSLRFCCVGCRMVYGLLSEAADATDPSQFKSTDLYRRCLAAGLIPGTEEDLERIAAPSPAEGEPPAPDPFRPSVADAGAQAALDLHLVVEGMWCPACAWVIEEALKKSPGIHGAGCNFSTDRVHCRYDPRLTAPDRISGIIQRLGYPVRAAGEETSHGAQRAALIRLLLAALLSANVMMLSFALYSGFFSRLSPEAVSQLSWPIFFLASGVVGYAGWPIYRKAWAGIRAKAPGMEVLIALGTLSAYAFSVHNFIQGSLDLYFDTACMLVTLVLIGKAIEEKARRRVQEDLDAFFALRPTKVRIIRPQWPKGRYVSAEQLAAQDIFLVEAGETVPADGVVLEGTAVVDESAITGEARPVAAGCGSSLKSGVAIVEGQLKVRAVRVGNASMLGQMIDIMERGLGRKTPLEGRTDRILKWFTPLILVLALATGLVGRWLGMAPQNALIRAVTVMVIACPCALGIAIPMARMAGISAAGRRGILVRDFAAFEAARQVDTVVFDKTGTLTTGQWNLIDIQTAPGFEREFILRLAAGLETGSPHFIAASIRNAAAAAGLEPLSFQDVVAQPIGISGRYQGVRYKIGNRDFLAAELAATAPDRSFQPSGDPAAVSRVYLVAGNQLAGVLIFGDRLRPTSPAAIERLKARHLKLHIVSGDEAAATRAVAGRLDLTDAHGGLLPQDKAGFIDRLRGQAHRVAMVGDGLNDAPALSRADLAVAVYSGHHLAKDTAHITLMRADCAQLPEFLDFAERVNRKIQQNLWCALVYNLISIPVAMAGLLSPLVAVTAMLLSSLSVTGNTLLLIRSERHRGGSAYRPEKPKADERPHDLAE